ncbi:MAG TPA: DUF2231 domain-containing protein [Blastocatellia bacterium]|nr:DUF2231 domain-containing protein [Blastocatellia bacterium]
MKTPASIMGHPVHPMLIPFPFALWTFSLVADAIYYFFDHNAASVWDEVSFYTMAAGIVGAVMAAVPGLIDYFSLKDRRLSKIAGWHARLNVFALLVFGASLYLRTIRGSAMVGRSLTVPVLLSILGIILISISGWLGGELVYKHGVAVEGERGGPPAT